DFDLKGTLALRNVDQWKQVFRTRVDTAGYQQGRERRWPAGELILRKEWQVGDAEGHSLRIRGLPQQGRRLRCAHAARKQQQASQAQHQVETHARSVRYTLGKTSVAPSTSSSTKIRMTIRIAPSTPPSPPAGNWSR